MPIHFHVDEQALIARGATNYWGYNTLGYFAPDVRFAASRDPVEAVREFKTMVRALHAAGLEVILDVVYNHTAEGDHLGPHLSFRGHRQHDVLPAAAGPALPLRGFHRLRQHAEHAIAAGAAAPDGQPALLGRGHARRRLPLRPRGGARARTPRRRSAVVVLRRDAAGSGHLARQVDRRTVGRGRRRLSGGQLPAGVDGMEQPVSRRRPPVLAGRRGHAAGTGDAAGRQQRSVRLVGPSAARQHQLRHGARRLHARRSGGLQRETQRRERRRQPRRRPEQRSAGTAASKVRPTTPRFWRCGNGSAAISW